MNIQSSIPLQEKMSFSDGEHGVMVQEYTRVNVQRKMPRDHIVWSLICCITHNPFCLGLAALIFSVKARDRKVVGDIEGARRYGQITLILNIISTVFFCLFVIITVIGAVAVVPPLIERYNSMSNRIIDDDDDIFGGGRYGG